MQTQIFLDSGDPKETRAVLDILGFLDGQTTNPSLIAKNPETAGKKYGKRELLDFYCGVAREVSNLLPNGSVSVEVYADQSTSAENMLEQARMFNTWIPNAHIKLPTVAEGLKAAEILVKGGVRVNMTLVFSQEQAAAVYAATKGAQKGQVYLSPFIGRLDDRGENGMDLISNVRKMYEAGDGHVEILAASVRAVDHFLAAMKFGSDIITAPFKVLKQWNDAGQSLPDEDFSYKPAGLKEIAYKDLSLAQSWQSFDISHELTDKGLEKFARDWNGLISAQ
jgi:transaldolase